MPFTQFLAQKIKIFKEKEKTPGYIIILHLHPKNHNHLMYSSLKMMPTALQVMLGQFLPFYSIFGPKLKFSKNEKMPKKNTKNTKDHKHTKNQNHIKCSFSDRVDKLFANFGPFLFLYPIFGPQKMLWFYILLGV